MLFKTQLPFYKKAIALALLCTATQSFSTEFLPAQTTEVVGQTPKYEQEILRKYRGMNESEASDFKLKAIASKATRDWHKEHPNENREPTPAETYKPILMIGFNPSLVELAIVEYEPERVRLEKAKTQALARENAKSRTPAFDALNPEQKLAVEWQVRQNYANAHAVMKDKDPTTVWKRAYNYDLFPKVFSIHGISKAEEGRLLNELSVLQKDVPFSRNSSVAGGSRMLGLYEDFIKNIEKKDLGSSAPFAKKWQERELEQIATHESLLNMAAHDFGLQQQNEKAVKNNLPVKNKYRTGRDRIMYEITQEGVLAREGCKWAEHGSLTEANPSALCSPSQTPN